MPPNWIRRIIGRRTPTNSGSVSELKSHLKRANERLQRAMKALAQKHKGGENEEFIAAHSEVLVYQRQFAAAKGEEYAEELDFPVKWDTGAPLPHLLVNDHTALLAFLISEPDPNWDGTYATMKSPSEGRAEPLGLVEFEHCLSAKLGTPNDEVFNGHPLNGKGLKAYSAQRVVNSRWIKELQAINSVHCGYRADSWNDLNHYIFWFHDTTFECVARSFSVETFRESFRDMLFRIASRLTD
jgi:hypothetical protein